MNNYISYQRQGKFQSSSITTEEVKESYQAIRLHFNSKHYHYGKYNGKVKKHNYSDMSIYSTIANGKKKTDFPNFFVPALFYNPKISLTYFITADYLTVWRDWQKYQSAPRHWFEQELLDVKTYLEKKKLKKEDLFIAREKEIPLLYKMVIRLEISPQTVNYLNDVLDFKKTMEKKVNETILFPNINQRLSKLSFFMKQQERTKLESIVKKVFLLDK